MKTTLINYRTYKLGSKDADKSKVTPIDRRSIFGNPFLLGRYSREESILQYSVWFYRQLEYRPEFVKAVKKLRGKALGCWCTPLPCHGDVIIEYLEGLETEGLE